MPGDHPRSPEGRMNKRNTITLDAVRQAIEQAIIPYLSIKCRDGDHFKDDPVFGSGGCQNDGSSCLCICHDRLGG